MGADDYLAKPFAMGELVARVKAMVRRNKEYQQTVLNLANVTLDLESNELSAKSGSLILSVKEAKLLALFLEKENVICKLCFASIYAHFFNLYTSCTRMI